MFQSRWRTGPLERIHKLISRLGKSRALGFCKVSMAKTGCAKFAIMGMLLLAYFKPFKLNMQSQKEAASQLRPLPLLFAPSG
jgi:hypothetical protein